MAEKSHYEVSGDGPRRQPEQGLPCPLAVLGPHLAVHPHLRSSARRAVVLGLVERLKLLLRLGAKQELLAPRQVAGALDDVLDREVGDGEGAARYVEHGAPTKVVCKQGRVQRGGHEHDTQVGVRGQRLAQHDEQKVRIDRPLVHLRREGAGGNGGWS